MARIWLFSVAANAWISDGTVLTTAIPRSGNISPWDSPRDSTWPPPSFASAVLAIESPRALHRPSTPRVATPSLNATRTRPVVPEGAVPEDPGSPALPPAIGPVALACGDTDFRLTRFATPSSSDLCLSARVETVFRCERLHGIYSEI